LEEGWCGGEEAGVRKGSSPPQKRGKKFLEGGCRGKPFWKKGFPLQRGTFLKFLPAE